MANSDPPVIITPVRNGELVVTAKPKPVQKRKAGEKPKLGRLEVDVQGKKLRLIVTKGVPPNDTRFEIPISEAEWSLEIS